MKTLYILRHAEATPDDGGGDFERPLTDAGIGDAKALGLTMKEKNYAPAYAACSSALRTRQTLEALMEAVKIEPVKYDRAIYHAGAADLFTFAQGLDDRYDSALLVGHNPTVHELAALLAADEPADLVRALARSYKPGTLSILAIPRASWKDLQPGENKLTDLLHIRANS
jgi:phosphohistidine phosphatase